MLTLLLASSSVPACLLWGLSSASCSCCRVHRRRAADALHAAAAAGELGEGGRGATVIYAHTDSLFVRLPNVSGWSGIPASELASGLLLGSPGDDASCPSLPRSAPTRRRRSRWAGWRGASCRARSPPPWTSNSSVSASPSCCSSPTGERREGHGCCPFQLCCTPSLSHPQLLLLLPPPARSYAGRAFEREEDVERGGRLIVTGIRSMWRQVGGRTGLAPRMPAVGLACLSLTEERQPAPALPPLSLHPCCSRRPCCARC